MEQVTRYIALTIVVISVIFSSQQFYMGAHDIDSPDSIYNLWAAVFTILIASWCQKDQRGKDWPFEFGFFVFLIWIFVLPYYLVKTRGTEGLIMFFGFSSLFIFPNIAWILGYQYS